MDQLLSNASKKRLSLLGWYQIIGGIVGCLSIIWALFDIHTLNRVFIVLSISSLLFCFSIYCGKLLLGPKYNTGLTLSYFNQLLQVLSFLFSGYGFMYASGLLLAFGVQYDTSLNFDFKFELSVLNLFWNNGGRSFDLCINIVAIYMLIFVDKLRHQIADESTNPEDEIVIPTMPPD